MKKLFLAGIFLLTSMLVAHSQNNVEAPIKLKSNIYRTLTRANVAEEWKTTDLLIDHIIVIDAKNKKIKTYFKDIASDFDILNMSNPETKAASVKYKFKCLDVNAAECDVELVIFEEKPFYILFTWKLKSEMFFLKAD